jgi:hypothetical protein
VTAAAVTRRRWRAWWAYRFGEAEPGHVGEIVGVVAVAPQHRGERLMRGAHFGFSKATTQAGKAWVCGSWELLALEHHHEIRLGD